MAAGAAVYFVFTAVSRWPDLTESFYGAGAGPLVSSLLSRASGPVPFSLAELLVLGLIALNIGLAVHALGRVRRGQRQLSNALAAGALRLGRDAGLLIGLFYLLWGFNYARAPLADRLELSADRDIAVEDVAALAEQMVEGANAAYLELHDAEDAGAPTRIEDRDALIAAINQGWETATTALGLPAAAAHLLGGSGRPGWDTVFRASSPPPQRAQRPHI
jgi:hypothetical protein